MGWKMCPHCSWGMGWGGAGQEELAAAVAVAADYRPARFGLGMDTGTDKVLWLVIRMDVVPLQARCC